MLGCRFVSFPSKLIVVHGGGGGGGGEGRGASETREVVPEKKGDGFAIMTGRSAE